MSKTVVYLLKGILSRYLALGHITIQEYDEAIEVIEMAGIHG